MMADDLKRLRQVLKRARPEGEVVKELEAKSDAELAELLERLLEVAIAASFERLILRDAIRRLRGDPWPGCLRPGDRVEIDVERPGGRSGVSAVHGTFKRWDMDGGVGIVTWGAEDYIVGRNLIRRP